MLLFMENKCVRVVSVCETTQVQAESTAQNLAKSISYAKPSQQLHQCNSQIENIPSVK